MTTKGIIRRLNTDKDNHFLVYIPLLQKANDKETSATLEATYVSIRGIEKTLKVGDIVYVDFEDNRFDKPVILGTLYLGKEDEKDIDTSISAQSLVVNNDTVLKNSANITGINLDKLDTDVRNIIEQYYTDSERVSYNNTKVLDQEESGIVPLESSILQDALDEIVIRLSNSDVSSLESRVEALESGYEHLSQDISDINNDIDNLESGFNRRIDELESGFDIRLDELESGFDNRLDILESGYNQISSDIEYINNDIDILESGVELNTQNISGLDNRVTYLEEHPPGAVEILDLRSS